MQAFSGVTKKQVLRYVALPGIMPRLSRLFAEGFHYIPYLLAVVYQTVRLLPASHPYTNPANIGRFGLRHVIAEAANHIVLDARNIDQIILFVCTIAGLSLLLVQICILVMAVVVQPAMAIVLPPANLFTTVAPRHDIAFMLLDIVFGVRHPTLPNTGFFQSCVSTMGPPCRDVAGADITEYFNPLYGSGFISPLAPDAPSHFPFAYHTGLHQMFQFYSVGLLIVAMIIALYFVVTILLETAESGTPFGKRYNKVWAPLRFVVAFGLLIPLASGLNSAQYLVLYAAKFGSGFATNGWNTFNNTLVGGFNNSYINSAWLIVRPNPPESTIGELIQFMFIARTCKYAEELAYNKDATPADRISVEPYLVRGVNVTSNATNAVQVVDPLLGGTTYENVLDFANRASTVTIRFGVRRAPSTTPVAGDSDVIAANESHYGWDKGYVKPVCGEIKFNLTDPRSPSSPENPGTTLLQRYYWYLIKKMWFMDWTGPFTGGEDYPWNIALTYGPWIPLDTPQPDPDTKRVFRDWYVREMRCVIQGPPCPFGAFPGVPIGGAALLQALSGRFAVPPALLEKGWAGAGIWYNRIAEMNGAFTAAVYNVPTVSRYPYVMEYVKEKKRQYNQATPYDEAFLPILADGRDIAMLRPEDENIIRVLNKAYDYWVADGGFSSSHTDSTGNIILDAINMMIGTDGLYSMRRNPDTHPLAQLVGVGRSLVESSIRSLAYGGIAKIFDLVTDTKGTARALASFFVSISMIGLTAGFILFYIVPFLPFIYFFFAVGGWVKGIFEAMVGAPLWALAHIRIDGNGLSGQAALNGYFLILEVFLRPILIVFGLLASILIFGAMVSVLNTTFDLVVSNLTGFDVDCETAGCGPTTVEFYRGPIDEFFFTVLYALLAYLMGLSSFKLIDQIPNNILRWMGSSVPTFNDQMENPVQSMVGYASIGAQQALGRIGGGLQQIIGNSK